MIEATIENYMILETILGGFIILLLMIIVWQNGQIKDALTRRVIVKSEYMRMFVRWIKSLFTKHLSKVPLLHSIPKDITEGDSIGGSEPLKGAATDNQFMRKKK